MFDELVWVSLAGGSISRVVNTNKWASSLRDISIQYVCWYLPVVASIHGHRSENQYAYRLPGVVLLMNNCVGRFEALNFHSEPAKYNHLERARWLFVYVEEWIEIDNWNILQILSRKAWMVASDFHGHNRYKLCWEKNKAEKKTTMNETGRKDI